MTFLWTEYLKSWKHLVFLCRSHGNVLHLTHIEVCQLSTTLEQHRVNPSPASQGSQRQLLTCALTTIVTSSSGQVKLVNQTTPGDPALWQDTTDPGLNNNCGMAKWPARKLSLLLPPPSVLLKCLQQMVYWCDVQTHPVGRVEQCPCSQLNLLLSSLLTGFDAQKALLNTQWSSR